MKFIVEIEPEFDETVEEVADALHECLRCTNMPFTIKVIPELELG